MSSSIWPEPDLLKALFDRAIVLDPPLPQIEYARGDLKYIDENLIPSLVAALNNLKSGSDWRRQLQRVQDAVQACRTVTWAYDQSFSNHIVSIQNGIRVREEQGR